MYILVEIYAQHSRRDFPNKYVEGTTLNFTTVILPWRRVYFLNEIMFILCNSTRNGKVDTKKFLSVQKDVFHKVKAKLSGSAKEKKEHLRFDNIEKPEKNNR